VKQSVFRKLDRLEHTLAGARQNNAWRNGPSGADVMRALLSRYAIEPRPGESRPEALAHAAEISTRELLNILARRSVNEIPVPFRKSQ
jgi:hypothetical protein